MRLIATIFIASCAMCMEASHAQLRKCTGPDGKVTYSDVVCAGGAAASSIKNPGGNSIDTSALRDDTSRLESQPAKATGESSASPPQDCKFEYYVLGDNKGKRLAANAKEECLRNNQAKLNGGPTSLEHYNFWRDYRGIKTSERQAAIANGNAAARAAQQSLNNVGKPEPKQKLTCRPNLRGTELECE